ncbi:MAG TPA: FecR domain-containing protein [Bacteroidales bacterium]|nr:FecR domain-containing protein [Bacteroidales bacterium]
MEEIKKYSDRDWEELAARFSGEQVPQGSENASTGSEDILMTEKKWKEIGMTNIKGEIDVDKAWNKLHGRLKENELTGKTVRINERRSASVFLRIAASVAIIAALGITALLIDRSGILAGDKTFIAANDQRNMEVSLPDGSKAWMNRNSRLSYNPKRFNATRKVNLTGEAFFDVVHDASRPFTIDAGKAMVADIGTSFNVITNNDNDEVEVFVSSGKVLLSDHSDSKKMILDPGYVGILSTSEITKTVNKNQNYLSWKTDILIFNGEKMSTVIKDLKRVYNISIVADNPGILDKQLSCTFDKTPTDVIIYNICLAFQLKYNKEGNIYHLSEK